MQVNDRSDQNKQRNEKNSSMSHKLDACRRIGGVWKWVTLHCSNSLFKNRGTILQLCQWTLSWNGKELRGHHKINKLNHSIYTKDYFYYSKVANSLRIWVMKQPSIDGEKKRRTTPIPTPLPILQRFYIICAFYAMSVRGSPSTIRSNSLTFFFEFPPKIVQCTISNIRLRQGCRTK